MIGFTQDYDDDFKNNLEIFVIVEFNPTIPNFEVSKLRDLRVKPEDDVLFRSFIGFSP